MEWNFPTVKVSDDCNDNDDDDGDYEQYKQTVDNRGNIL